MMHIATSDDVQADREPRVHEHAWVVESAHDTSEGRVLYVRCGGHCGARRIDLQGSAEVPPNDVSVVVGGWRAAQDGLVIRRPSRVYRQAVAGKPLKPRHPC